MGHEESNPSDQGKIAAVADALATSVPGITGISAIDGTVSGTTVTFNNLTPGYYLVLSNATDAKPVIISSMVNGRTKLGSQTLGQGEVKDPHGIQTNPKKTIKVHGTDTTASLSGTTKNVSVNVGQPYDFALSFAVPNKLSYATFTATDTPTNMTIDPKSIKVKVGSGAEQTYDLSTTTSDSTKISGLKVSLDNGVLTLAPDPDVTPTGTGADTQYSDAAQFVKDHSGETVTVTYTATINDASAHNDFQVKVNPLHGQPVTPPPVIIKTNSYKVNLHKISAEGRDGDKKTSVDKDKIGLQHAKFSVQDTTNTAHPQYLKFDAATGKWSPVAAETDSELETDEHGNINLTGLGAGTYHFKETQAPTGFLSSNLPEFDLTVTQVAATPANADVTVAGTGLNSGLVDVLDDAAIKTYVPGTGADNAGEKIQTIVVANMNSLTQLPQTGGAGVIAITLLLALLLIAGAGVGLAAHKVAQRHLNTETAEK